MLPYYGVFDNLVYLLQGRTVILTGQVTNPSLKPDAERAVKKVEGIDKVINNIEILPPSPIDQQIRERVRQVIYGGYGPLFKYSRNPNPPIRIIVKNARVTLEGVVDSEGDKNLCTNRVNQNFFRPVGYQQSARSEVVRPRNAISFTPVKAHRAVHTNGLATPDNVCLCHLLR